LLSSLYIKNIAVIEEVSIDFNNGFTALTGETGAGKSIIIDALNMLLGERASKDIIRTGADFALVIGTFTDVKKVVLDKLDELSIPLTDTDIMIQREIRQNRSISKINGMPVVTATLKEIGELLVSIQGQHDSYELLSSDTHMSFIDAFHSDPKQIEEYKSEYQALRKYQKELDELLTLNKQSADKREYLEYKVKEISDAKIIPGEKDELTDKLNKIRNGAQISKNLSLLYKLFNGDGLSSEGIVADLKNSATLLSEISESDKNLSKLNDSVNDLYYQAESISEDVGGAFENFDFDPKDQEYIEERLDLIYKLSLKYGGSEESILEVLKESEEQLNEITNLDDRINETNNLFVESKHKAIQLAKSISEERKNISKEFSAKVLDELSYLNMPGVKFSIKQDRIPLNENGCDKIEFFVSANAGEELRPLTKVASGGELSRIMLAIRTVLSNVDTIDTLIFDEIDAGISGETANKVGKKLKDIASGRQVICITHLAQIAAMTDNHILVSKYSTESETKTIVRQLNREERIRELARIISGNEMTDIKLKMAAELLDKA
jgi:DNA repair protein RecN (Recombination protein N)